MNKLTAAHDTTRLASIRRAGVVECAHRAAPGCVINRHSVSDCVRRDDYPAHNRRTFGVCSGSVNSGISHIGSVGSVGGGISGITCRSVGSMVRRCIDVGGSVSAGSISR